MDCAAFTEHDSWLSADLLWGCPNNCGYCYLRSRGLVGVRPKLKFPFDDNLLGELALALGDCPLGVPVSIGNCTDMLATEESLDMLCRIAGSISRIDQTRLIVIITKSKVSESAAKRIAEATAGHGLLVLSQSFCKDSGAGVEKGRTSSPTETYESLVNAAKTEGLVAMHFWRPFLSAWNLPCDIAQRIKKLRDSGSVCSVVIGIKGSRQLADSYSEELKTWAAHEFSLGVTRGDERISGGRLKHLLQAATAAGYPVFRQTSCAMAFVQGAPDINGTSASGIKSTHCDKVNCPQAQRLICKNDPLLEKEAIHIPGEIDEFSYNHLVHVYHKPPMAGKVNVQKAWRGNIINEVKSG
ncbi:MAG: hypothetical protein FWG42_03535 [Clostridiales bacterium]|nr:hypothetical protein [Clostridiales bacterium]